ncbi:MAG: phosphatidate cytidylyltransferase [Treponema sp.]|jgi:phosphatidate cytidylyltransferase|nr:phosphatidate cytidylyltransferase [Treponema sp.]
MKKLVERLFVFFVGLPLIIFIILFLPFQGHLVFNIIVIISSALGAVEFARILEKKNLVIRGPEAFVLGSLLPLAAAAEISFGAPQGTVLAALVLGASWLFVSRVFSREERLVSYTSRAAAGLSVMIYPGLFTMWIIRMAVLAGRTAGEDAVSIPAPQSVIILVFVFTVMINDSIAWAAGMLLGKNNRGIMPVSPNKSVAGFVGGIAAAVLAGAAGVLLFPSVFVPRLFPPVPSGLVMGFLMGTAASLGDLLESAFKRSSGVKDSGAIIPGRGGVLDSIDSVAFAAPVFYITYRVLFGP